MLLVGSRNVDNVTDETLFNWLVVSELRASISPMGGAVRSWSVTKTKIVDGCVGVRLVLRVWLSKTVLGVKVGVCADPVTAHPWTAAIPERLPLGLLLMKLVGPPKAVPALIVSSSALALEDKSRAPATSTIAVSPNLVISSS